MRLMRDSNLAIIWNSPLLYLGISALGHNLTKLLTFNLSFLEKGVKSGRIMTAVSTNTIINVTCPLSEEHKSLKKHFPVILGAEGS